MRERDRAPIDQRWVQDYVDQFLKASQGFPPGPMQDAVFRRIECVMDLVDAWQKRNWPKEKR